MELAEYQRIAAFREALRGFMRQSEEIAREHGLTPQRYVLLLMIKGAPDGSQRATVSDLVERLHLNQSTVTELVGRAEDVGLLKRERSEEDRRVFYLSLTTAAEDMLDKTVTVLFEERHTLRRALEYLPE